MKEVIVKYDDAIGQIYDINGFIVASFVGLQYKDVTKNNVETLIKLKSAGYTVDEIIQMHHQGLI